jgi:hypothetical protein
MDGHLRTMIFLSVRRLLLRAVRRPRRFFRAETFSRTAFQPFFSNITLNGINSGYMDVKKLDVQDGRTFTDNDFLSGKTLLSVRRLLLRAVRRPRRFFRAETFSRTAFQPFFMTARYHEEDTDITLNGINSGYMDVKKLDVQDGRTSAGPDDFSERRRFPEQLFSHFFRDDSRSFPGKKINP